MTMEVLDQVVTISEETQYRMAVHEAFCQHGESWLLKHDPECQKEFELIEAAKQALADDFEKSIKELPEDTQEDLIDDFNSLDYMDYMDYMDYWWELREAVGLGKGDDK